MTEVILDDKQACKFTSSICVVDILEYIVIRIRKSMNIFYKRRKWRKVMTELKREYN